jgi:hypothetical protein
MYGTVLLLHSLLRWLVLIAGILAAARGFSGWRSRRPWTLPDERAGFWFTMTLDLQFLLGLLLYGVLSPITAGAFQDFGGAMKDSVARFWAVEHAFGMIVAITLAHIGRSRIHKTGNDGKRHKLAAIFFTIALVVILASIPWPTLPHGRPLLRW